MNKELTNVKVNWGELQPDLSSVKTAIVAGERILFFSILKEPPSSKSQVLYQFIDFGFTKRIEFCTDDGLGDWKHKEGTTEI